MSKWITDREPTAEDADYQNEVWVTTTMGSILRRYWSAVDKGQPWIPITPPEPYVKIKRYGVREHYTGSGKFVVYDIEDGLSCSSYLPTREAADRIAAIYEEVMP